MLFKRAKEIALEDLTRKSKDNTNTYQIPTDFLIIYIVINMETMDYYIPILQETEKSY